MERIVKAELLDQLPEDHPKARRNRREIHWINRLMGNYRWFTRVLPRVVQPTDRILELGAGTGQLAAYVKAKAAHLKCADYNGLDFADRPADWPAADEWHCGDLLDFKGYDKFSCIVGNLILHQFTAEQIRTIAPALASRRLLVFNEPYRSLRNALSYRVAAYCALSYVSRHDGEVSIRAGFRPGELPSLLGLSHDEWMIHETVSHTGACRLVAIRK